VTCIGSCSAGSKKVTASSSLLFERKDDVQQSFSRESISTRDGNTVNASDDDSFATYARLKKEHPYDKLCKSTALSRCIEQLITFGTCHVFFLLQASTRTPKCGPQVAVIKTTPIRLLAGRHLRRISRAFYPVMLESDWFVLQQWRLERPGAAPSRQESDFPRLPHASPQPLWQPRLPACVTFTQRVSSGHRSGDGDRRQSFCQPGSSLYDTSLAKYLKYSVWTTLQWRLARFK